MSVDTSRPPKLVGDDLEAATCDALAPLAAVPDDVAEWHDARLETQLTARDGLRLIGRVSIPAGRPVEIKACQRWTKDGANGRRRGRWYIKRDAHEKLAASQALYVLLVYDGETGAVLARLGAPARTVGRLVDTWTAVNQSWGTARVTKLSWNRLLDPETVEEEGR